MNEKNENVGEEDIIEQTMQASVRLPSRRRLIKLGAAGVPVVATLASSPAMAWNCRAPSAWGSNMSGDLTASQVANQAKHQDYQKSYVDETWYVSNWAGNTARAKTGFSDKPWVKLKALCPTIYDQIAKNAAKTKFVKIVNGAEVEIPEADLYQYVTIAALVSATGITKPSDCGSSDLVVTKLTSGSDFAKSIITAQLNFLFPTGVNQMRTCVFLRGQNQLQIMASGSYQPAGGGTAWEKSQIVSYLQKNYMAKP